MAIKITFAVVLFGPKGPPTIVAAHGAAYGAFVGPTLVGKKQPL
jgi:hypothetical protein